jgi:hypothetical protein
VFSSTAREGWVVNVHSAVGLPKKTANLPHAAGAEPLPKTKQGKTQNLTSMATTVRRSPRLRKGIWWDASEMPTPNNQIDVSSGDDDGW